MLNKVSEQQLSNASKEKATLASTQTTTQPEEGENPKQQQKTTSTPQDNNATLNDVRISSNFNPSINNTNINFTYTTKIAEKILHHEHRDFMTIFKQADIEAKHYRNYIRVTLTPALVFFKNISSFSTGTALPSALCKKLYNAISAYSFSVNTNHHIEISTISFSQILKQCDSDVHASPCCVFLKPKEAHYTEKIGTRNNLRSKLNLKSRLMKTKKDIEFYESQNNIALHYSHDHTLKWRKTSVNNLQNYCKIATDFIAMTRQELQSSKEAMLDYITPDNVFIKVKMYNNFHFIRKEILTQLNIKNKIRRNKEGSSTIHDINGTSWTIDPFIIDHYLHLKMGEYSYVWEKEKLDRIILIPSKHWKTEFENWKTFNSAKTFRNHYTGQDMELKLKDIIIPNLDKIEIYLTEAEKQRRQDNEKKRALNAVKQQIMKSINIRSVLVETKGKKIITYQALLNMINSDDDRDECLIQEHLNGKEEYVSRRENEEWIVNDDIEYVEIGADGWRYLVKKKELIEAVNSVERADDEIILTNYLNEEEFKIRVKEVNINNHVNNEINEVSAWVNATENRLMIANDDCNGNVKWHNNNNKSIILAGEETLGGGGERTIRDKKEVESPPEAWDDSKDTNSENENVRMNSMENCPINRSWSVRLAVYKLSQV